MMQGMRRYASGKDNIRRVEEELDICFYQLKSNSSSTVFIIMIMYRDEDEALFELYRSCFHEVTVVRKIRTQIVCDFHSLPSLRENRDDMIQYCIQCSGTIKKTIIKTIHFC